MAINDEQQPGGTGARIFKTSKKVLSKTGEVTGKVLEKAIEASATGIDKSTGASKYQTDALAINGRLERALQVIETALAQKTDENVQLAQQLRQAQSEVAQLRAQLNHLESRIGVTSTETSMRTGTVPKKKWWQRTKVAQ